MRQPRLKAPREHPAGYHHCLSRVVNRDFVFGELEKETFVDWMGRYAVFCGVKVLTYCILSNHFHLLIEVPRPPDQRLSPGELLLRCASIYETPKLEQIQEELNRLENQPEALAVYEDQFLCRMWDVSHFMKSLKQRFTQWFNGTRPAGRQGTLWEERFKSILVEGTSEALSTIAAYIDLNPVRAKIVADPKDYRWSGYGAAVGGNKTARENLAKVLPPGSQDLASYRKLLYVEGMEEGVSTVETPVRAGISPEEVRKVLNRGGELSMKEALQCRVRYFADGAVLGSQKFSNEIFTKYREHFGVTRRSGARPLRGIDTTSLGGLFGLRNLRRQPIG